MCLLVFAFAIIAFGLCIGLSSSGINRHMDKGRKCLPFYWRRERLNKHRDSFYSSSKKPSFEETYEYFKDVDRPGNVNKSTKTKKT